MDLHQDTFLTTRSFDGGIEYVSKKLNQESPSELYFLLLDNQRKSSLRVPLNSGAEDSFARMFELITRNSPLELEYLANLSEYRIDVHNPNSLLIMVDTQLKFSRPKGHLGKVEDFGREGNIYKGHLYVHPEQTTVDLVNWDEEEIVSKIMEKHRNLQALS